MLQPYTKECCTLCDLPWDKHVRIAMSRAREAQMLDWDEEGTEPTINEVNAQLKPEICVALLKVANRGPVGPAGAPGPQGPAGLRA